jgi:hypothetical protein
LAADSLNPQTVSHPEILNPKFEEVEEERRNAS